jgi:hypothetical protein
MPKVTNRAYRQVGHVTSVSCHGFDVDANEFEIYVEADSLELLEKKRQAMHERYSYQCLELDFGVAARYVDVVWDELEF